MLSTRYSALATILSYTLVATGVCVAAHGQTTPQTNPKLSINAALVLTPEFCATIKKVKLGNGQVTLDTGKAACARLEPALRSAFASLTRVEAPPSLGDAQVVLKPIFMEGAAQMGWSLHQEIVVLVEWTVKDKLGKTVWIETVQGSARNRMGNGFTYKKNVRQSVEESVENMAEETARKMASAPELRKLASGSSSSEPAKN